MGKEETELLKLAEVKKMLRVDGRTLKQWAVNGTLPAAISVKKVTRYNKQMVESFINKNTAQ